MIYLESFFILFLSTVVLTILFIRVSHRLKLIDIPQARSLHIKLTPRGGGIVFTLVALVWICLTQWQLVVQNYYIFVSILMIMAMGIMDDVIGCKPKTKFIALFFAVALLHYNGFSITSLGTFFTYDISLHWLLVFPFTLFAMAGFTNALNLIDGIDGLSTGVSIIILTTFLVIGIKFDDALMIVLSSSFIFTLLGFLVLNWHPARIFMGDSGSLTLGFIIAILAIQSLAYINPSTILFIAAIPILDTMIVIFRRKQRKLSIFKADKNHLHHIIFRRNEDVKFTVRLLYKLQLVFAILGYRSIGQDDAWNVVLFVLFMLLFLNLFDPRDKRRKQHRYRKNLNKVYKKMYKWTALHNTKTTLIKENSK